MSGYPQGEVLLAKCRAGLGKIVIVEGESIDQDPYFYGRWSGWFEVVKAIHRGTRPPQWDSLAAVESQVLAAYQCCLGLAAWNCTVKREYERLPADPGGVALGYKAYPTAVPDDAPVVLDAWGASRGAPTRLGAVFTDELTRLQAAPLAEWQRRVTGKAVLKVFQQAFPAVGARHLLDNLYITLYPQPPDDLVQLVRTILGER